MCEKYKKFFNECLESKKENEMNVVDFLGKENDDRKYEIAIEIIKYQDKIIANYLEKICKELKKESKDFDEWECDLSPFIKYHDKENKFVFLPKERGEYFFAFVWRSRDNKKDENSFRVRLLGSKRDSRANIVEK